MKDDVLRILLSEEEIKNRVNEIGKQITKDYKDKNLVLVTILKGAAIFLADLMRFIDINCNIDFMVVSSYGSGTKTSGVVKIVKDLEIDITGKDILIIEDILDSGMTLNYITGILSSRNPNSIEVCTLLDKPLKREVTVDVKYKGFTVPDEFVIGYGLDYDEKYRNLPYIGILKPEVYL
ncbi:MAG: hypoxanthine phosphoribosyltransferase [Oscillospiraceae bacterium]